MMSHNSYRHKGFSIASTLFILSLLGLLIGFMVPSFVCACMSYQARVARVYTDFYALETALRSYYRENSTYPSTEQGLAALIKKPSLGPVSANWRKLLDSEPQDPWGNVYYYRSPGQYGDFDIYTLGADGVTGGEGDSKDRGNWEESGSNDNLF